jgi:hypothetical protein
MSALVYSIFYNRNTVQLSYCKNHAKVTSTSKKNRKLIKFQQVVLNKQIA